MTERTASPCFIGLTVQTIEDLHTGTGTGSGDIDALAQRDRRERPVIRASHFRGLLREAGADAKVEPAELDELLGAQGTSRGALRMTSLRVRAGGRTLVWGSTKRVEGGRAPEADTLRFVEHVAAGTCFEARLRLPDATLQPLLEQLLNRVDRIGGDRNRGSGLVKLDWQPQAAAVTQQAATITQQPAISVSTFTLRLVLRNLEPLCLPATGHPGNLIRTQSFIRGQTLRGALIAWAIHNGRPESLAMFDRISVGDALPLPENVKSPETVLPIPLSILSDKPRSAGTELPWWADGSPLAPDYDSLGEERSPEEKPKRPGAHEYLCRTGAGDPWRRYTPAMRVRLRNATPRHGTQADAKLFSLEEIAEDTRFQAELRFTDQARAQDFLHAITPLFGGGDWLGIGRGGPPVIIESLTVSPSSVATNFSDGSVADAWTLTLTSDLILRGEHLGFLDHLDIDRLCQLAEIPKQDGWIVDKAMVETEAVHGFNAVSGLHRASALAIRRGSTWRIAGTGSTVLARALASRPALGERIAEGFGRFLIDVQPISAIERPGIAAVQPLVNRSEEILSLARTLSGKIGKGGATPSLSQLQWLREQALAAANDHQLDGLVTEIETASQRRPQGGKAWNAFVPVKLRDELAGMNSFAEKRQLISYLVQWRVPQEKEKRK